VTCGIGAAGEVEQDFGCAHGGGRGVMWKRDGQGPKIKEEQAEARRGLWEMPSVQGEEQSFLTAD